jgi:hypothetical protein
MSRDFFDPTPEEQIVILVDSTVLREAERLIESCEKCNSEGAQMPFDAVLDRVTASDPTVTDYILDAKCPNCRQEITEKTLIAHVEADGCLLFEEVVKMDLEGIVCKRKDSPYKVTDKPSRHWIKVKNSRYSQLEGRGELFERRQS